MSDNVISHPRAERPHDADSERSILAWLCRASSQQVQWLREDVGVEPHHFYRPLHQDLLRWVYERHARGISHDDQDWLLWVRATPEREKKHREVIRHVLEEVFVDPPAYDDDVERDARRVRESWVRREVIHHAALAQRAARAAHESSGALRQWEESTEALKALRTVRERAAPLDQVLEEALADTTERVTTRKRGQERKVALPTGFPGVDRMLGGGLEGGDLVIVAARPSMGKTSLMQTICLQVAKHVQDKDERGAVVIFSAEMVRLKLGRRILSEAAKVNTRDMRSGTLSRSDMDRMERVRDELGTLPVWIDDTSRPTLRYIRQVARQREHAAGRLALVAVDYLQILGSEGGRSREEEVSRLSSGLKALANEFGCVVLALAQLNREVEKRKEKKPTIADLRDSGAIEQDADVILFPFRAAVYDKLADLYKGEIIVAKARDGQVGPVEVRWVPLYGFYEPKPEPSPSKQQDLPPLAPLRGDSFD